MLQHRKITLPRGIWGDVMRGADADYTDAKHGVMGMLVDLLNEGEAPSVRGWRSAKAEGRFIPHQLP